MYDSCQMGKHHHSTYHSRDSIPSSHAFDLVHSNIWRPSCVPTLPVYMYYIILVDDYTCVSWIYLIKDQLFALFVSLSKRSLPNIPPHPKSFKHAIFPSDSMEILCWSRYHPPKLSLLIITYHYAQNGVFERKHGILLYNTRIVLYKMHVPHFLWYDAFMMDMYLHNCLPSSPLAGVIIIHHPFLATTLVALPPSAFGCTTFFWTALHLSLNLL